MTNELDERGLAAAVRMLADGRERKRSLPEQATSIIRAYLAATRAEPEGEADVRREHKWVPSTLGHGEMMCRHCMMTNREAAAAGYIDYCGSRARAPTVDARDQPSRWW